MRKFIRRKILPIFENLRFVSKLFVHLAKLHSLAMKWDGYERDVKNLLNWIMSEANRFSGEVTSRGDKGVEDHIHSCKVCRNEIIMKVLPMNV